MNEIAPIGSYILNTWSPFYGTVWEELGSVVLLGGDVNGVSKPTPFLVSSLCLMLVSQDVRCHLLLQHRASLPAAMLSATIIIDANPLKL